MAWIKNKKTQTSAFGTSGRFSHNATKFYNSRLYQEVKSTSVSYKKSNAFPFHLQDNILLETSENMQAIPDNSVHLMITSPPYNVSKEYDSDLALSEYLTMLRKVFAETYRVLVNGGRACINVANLGRKPYIPLSSYITSMMIKIGYNMRGEVIWHKAASASPSTAWGSWMSASNPTLRDVHEYILIFSKGDYKRGRNDNESKSKCNTIQKADFMEWTKSVWTFHAASAKRIGHPAPFPIDLPYRLIQLYSFTKDIILDPFMGSGTTAIAALQSERHYIGFEVCKAYLDLANKRLSKYKTEASLQTSSTP